MLKEIEEEMLAMHVMAFETIKKRNANKNRISPPIVSFPHAIQQVQKKDLNATTPV